MTTEVEKSGKDTWVDSDKPNLNRQGAPKLGLEAGDAFGFLAPSAAIPDGATVTTATYGVFAAGASTGSRQLTMRTPNAGWKPGQITFAHQPSGVTGPSATVTVGALADGDLIEFNVRDILQAWVDGTTDTNGIRLASDAATRHKVYSYDSDHPPVLTYSYALPGDPPTDLAPSTGAVGVAKPWLTGTYVDLDDADLTFVRVQIDTAQDGVSPDYDSTDVDSTVAELDLSRTDLPVLFGGLTAGVGTFWRMEVVDSAGHRSGWSDWSPLLYRPQGTLTISSPGVGGVVKDVTPDITWALAGATQKAWQVRVVYASDPSQVLYDTGKRTGTTTTHTLPEGVIRDERDDLVVIVRVWDTYVRETIKGSASFVQATRTFTMGEGSTGAPYQFTVYTEKDHPEVVLTWVDEDPPDTYTVFRDHEPIATLLDPADLLVEGSTDTYEWKDWTAQPRREVTYWIRSVVAHEQSQRSPEQSITPRPKGVWLVDPSTETWICCSGLGGLDSWGRGDAFGVYMPLGATKPVKITTGMSAKEQPFSGEITTRSPGGRTVEEQLLNLWALAEHPDRVLRLIPGDRNIPVIVADLADSTHSDLQADLDRVRVTWTHWQYGGYPFKRHH
jgi:hypothetical protein